MKTAVEQAVDALRLWSNDWNEFDKTGENKPKSIEEVIAPFIQMEKEQMIEFASKCIHRNSCFFNIEEYYETFKQQEQ
jgi:hypothetical protein